MKTLIKISIILSAFLLFATAVEAQVTEEESFEEYKKQQSQDFQKYVEEETKAYEQYMREEQQAIEKLRKEVEDFWGTGESKSSTKKDWVEYS